MDWRKLITFNYVIAAAVMFAFLSQIIHSIGAVATMEYYTDPQHFNLWSELMMPGEGPPGTAFFAASLALNFLAGMIFAGMYVLLRKAIPGDGLRKGINYGFILFLISSVPMAFSSYLTLAIPLALLMAWSVEALAIFLVSGLVFAKLLQ